MAAQIPTRELAPKPGHSGHALVPMGIASGIPRMSTSTMSSTIPSFSAADRSMARFMLALTPFPHPPKETTARDLTASEPGTVGLSHPTRGGAEEGKDAP